MSVITTLNFCGRTEESLDYFSQVLDAEIVFLMRFRESPDQSYARPGMDDLIFHATFRIDGAEFMASDVGYVDKKSVTEFKGFALAL